MTLGGGGRVASARYTGESGTARKLRLNITDGYMEVFVDDQFMTNVIGERVTPGFSFALGQRFDQLHRGKARFSDVRIRRWPMKARPDTLDDPEKFDLESAEEWFAAASREFPDQPYYSYRLALACFNAGEYDRAAELAQSAVAAGLSPNMTRLLTGFVHDLAGDETKAAECYARSEDDGLQFRLVHNAFREDDSTCPELIADSFRLWLAATAPGARPKEQGVSTEFYARHSEPWVTARLEAARHAYRASFGSAADILKKALDKNLVPNDYVQVTREQMEAYQNGQLWTRKEGEKPFYHNVKLFVKPKRPIRKDVFIQF